MKVKQWFENFWYHYKWTVIIATFFIVVAVVCISQMATKEHYDMYIRYVGDASISDTQYQDIKRAFEKTKLDLNDDGETVVSFEQVAYISDPDNLMINEINSMAKETLSVLVSQQYYIYLMDTAAYEVYKDSNAFERLDMIFEEDISDIAYDDYAIRFSQTDFCKGAAGMEWVEDDIVMVLKIAPYKLSIKPTKDPAEVKLFEFHRELFKTMALGRAK